MLLVVVLQYSESHKVNKYAIIPGLSSIYRMQAE